MIGDSEMCIGGCFMVPKGGPGTSKIAAAGRARATGEGRVNDLKKYGSNRV